MSWFETIEGIITLITALVALLSGLITLGVKLKAALKTVAKDKNWKKIMEIALVAIEKAEETGAAGADKKTQVIESVKATCATLGIDCSNVLDELSAFIDSSVSFANNLQDTVEKLKEENK